LGDADKDATGVVHDLGDLAVHDLAGIRDFSAVDVDDALEAHADAQDEDLASEVGGCCAGDARVCVGVAGAGGNDDVNEWKLSMRRTSIGD
jgi:hypothetical protein